MDKLFLTNMPLRLVFWFMYQTFITTKDSAYIKHKHELENTYYINDHKQVRKNYHQKVEDVST